MNTKTTAPKPLAVFGDYQVWPLSDEERASYNGLQFCVRHVMPGMNIPICATMSEHNALEIGRALQLTDIASEYLSRRITDRVDAARAKLEAAQKKSGHK